MTREKTVYLMCIAFACDMCKIKPHACINTVNRPDLIGIMNCFIYILHLLRSSKGIIQQIETKSKCFGVICPSNATLKWVIALLTLFFSPSLCQRELSNSIRILQEVLSWLLTALSCRRMRLELTHASPPRDHITQTIY